MTSKSNVLTVPKSLESKGPADFETAIAATKFGKFNLIFLLMVVPAAWINIFETTNMSYVFPAAQCDLDLTLDMKGSLNAISFSGMVLTGFFWGFVADTLGRKKLIVYGFLAHSIVVILTGFSQNYVMLMVLKFSSGLILNGAAMTLTPYLSEFHSLRYRSRVLVFLGVALSMGMVVLPLGAMLILPLDIELRLFSTYVLHSWNIYIFLCALPSLISTVTFSFMPESPKFFMAVGRNEEALQVFRKIYATNTGNAEENYQVKELNDEITLNEDNKRVGKVTANRSPVVAIKEGFRQMKPLLRRPLSSNLLLILLVHFLLSMGNNSVRLWMPQLFTAFHNYKLKHNTTTQSLCDVLEFVQPNVTITNGISTCSVNLDDSWMHLNSAIVAIVMVCGFTVSGLLINAVGKKKLMFAFNFLGGFCGFGLYFAGNTAVTITLSALFLSFATTSAHIITMVVIDYFPTTSRATTVSLLLMTGRIGSVSGNMIFPLLLATGCLPPFMMVGGLILSCTLLTLFLPKTHLKGLE